MEYRELTEQIIEAVLEINRTALKNIDNKLINLFSLASDKKELDSKQIAGILRVTINKTITTISQNIILIIDKNNLVENEDEILKDIKNIVNEEIHNSKMALEEMGVPAKDIEIFLNKIEAIKTDSYEKLVEYFTVATFEIRNINEGIERVIDSFEECQNIKEFLSAFKEFTKKTQIKGDDYCKLKRRVLTLVDSFRSQLYD